jgi:steroid 5-alpha reductase family enzyme
MTDVLFNLGWLTLILGILPSCLLFGGTWLIAWRLNNWSIVDVTWSYGFAIAVALPFIFLPEQSWELVAQEWHSNPVLWLAVATFIWSLRLGTHLAIRVLGHLDKEDGRYLRMREQHGAKMPWKMAVFYFQQGIALTVLLLPFFSAAADGGRTPASWIHGLGLGLFISGMVIEARGDAQLAQFKADPANRGKVCDVGLWAWTRHPNYFGEFLIWSGFACLSFTPNLLGIPGVLCAATLWYLVTQVTGIPLTEAQLLKSKGEAYKAYQGRVPAFWPRRPRA